MSEAIIEITDLVKTYETGEVQVHALRGVSLSVRPAEMVAIMGPSGCGKTTLLNTASGLDDPTEGSIMIEGTDLDSLDDNTKTSYRARRMGFIFQFYNLLPVLSSIENVELPLLVSGVAPSEARERAMAGLEQVGLAEWAEHRPGQLSGGQRQRVTIARALRQRPGDRLGRRADRRPRLRDRQPDHGPARRAQRVARSDLRTGDARAARSPSAATASSTCATARSSARRCLVG